MAQKLYRVNLPKIIGICREIGPLIPKDERYMDRYGVKPVFLYAANPLDALTTFLVGIEPKRGQLRWAYRKLEHYMGEIVEVAPQVPSRKSVQLWLPL